MGYRPVIAPLREQEEAQKRAIAAQERQALLQGLVYQPLAVGVQSIIPALREKYLPTDQEVARTALMQARGDTIRDQLEQERRKRWEYENAPLGQAPGGGTVANVNGVPMIVGGPSNVIPSLQAQAQTPVQMAPPVPFPTLEMINGGKLQPSTPTVMPAMTTREAQIQVPPTARGGQAIPSLGKNPWESRLGAMPEVETRPFPVMPQMEVTKAPEGTQVARFASGKRKGPLASIMDVSADTRAEIAGKTLAKPMTARDLDRALMVRQYMATVDAPNAQKAAAYGAQVDKWYDEQIKAKEKAEDNYMKAVGDLTQLDVARTNASPEYAKAELDKYKTLLDMASKQTAAVTRGETDWSKLSPKQQGKVKDIATITQRNLPAQLRGSATTDFLIQSGGLNEAERDKKVQDVLGGRAEVTLRGAQTDKTTADMEKAYSEASLNYAKATAVEQGRPINGKVNWQSAVQKILYPNAGSAALGSTTPEAIDKAMAWANRMQAAGKMDATDYDTVASTIASAGVNPGLVMPSMRPYTPSGAPDFVTESGPSAPVASTDAPIKVPTLEEVNAAYTKYGAADQRYIDLYNAYKAGKAK